MVNGAPPAAELGDESAEGDHTELVILVVPVRVAVLEVLDEGVVGAVLRGVVLSTSPSRRLASISGVTAPDQSASCWGSPVSVVRMAVALWASGSTRFIKRSDMMALTVMQQALRKNCART